jgi:heat shock protein HslJ
MRYALVGAFVLALVAGCAPMSQPSQPAPKPAPVVDASPLAGPVWAAIEIAARPVLTEATLLVEADGTVSGTSGCNNFAGQSMVVGDAIAFDDLASTRMACTDPQMQQEARYYQALSAATRYRMGSDTLRLLDDSGATLVLYRR